jgi:hypothetical protein
MKTMRLLGTMLLISGAASACAAGDFEQDPASEAPNGAGHGGPTRDAAEAPSAAPERTGARAENVGRNAEALGAPRLYEYASVGYGGNIVEQDHFPIWGGDCSPGYKRSGVPRTRKNGNGACEFLEWDNPDNERDCRAQGHIHTNAFWGGVTCEHWIYEERAAPGACRDSSGLRCGGASADGSCFCDEACLYYGDCCFDYTTYC